MTPYFWRPTPLILFASPICNSRSRSRYLCSSSQRTAKSSCLYWGPGLDHSPRVSILSRKKVSHYTFIHRLMYIYTYTYIYIYIYIYIYTHRHTHTHTHTNTHTHTHTHTRTHRTHTQRRDKITATEGLFWAAEKSHTHYNFIQRLRYNISHKNLGLQVFLKMRVVYMDVTHAYTFMPRCIHT
jgi:hypothetical protein